MINLSNLRPITNIGVVCDDGSKISPIITYFLRLYAIKSSKKHIRDIIFWNASIKQAIDIKDSVKGYFQKKGVSTFRSYKIDRVSKNWMKNKDLIITADRFSKKKLIYDFTIDDTIFKDKIFTLPEIINSTTRLRDPGDDSSSNNTEFFDLIDQFCKTMISILEKYDK